MKIKIILMTAFLLFACGREVALEGKWVQPIPGMDGQQGISLEKNGKASSINMSTLLYEAWRQDGNKLILTGQSLGNGLTIDFEAVYEIVTLNAQNLVLKDGESIETYQRQ